MGVIRLSVCVLSKAFSETDKIGVLVKYEATLPSCEDLSSVGRFSWKTS